MNSHQSKCAIIIITRNSQKFLYKAIAAVEMQTVQPKQIIIVDTGSEDLSYLTPYREKNSVTVVIGEKDMGFCRGNNLGYKYVSPDIDYVLLLNPDAFLFENFLEKAGEYMEQPENRSCAILTGKVFSYNIDRDTPTGLYDTTGIFQTGYGRWFDRGQGVAVAENLYTQIESVPAICGALMFCRKTDLDEVLIRKEEIFDSSFFMYKEDIDLSIRMRQKGKHLTYHPDLKAYHCRGWNPDRKQMPKKLRACSARNELKIHWRLRSPIKSAYSALKYAAVVLFNR